MILLPYACMHEVELSNRFVCLNLKMEQKLEMRGQFFYSPSSSYG